MTFFWSQQKLMTSLVTILSHIIYAEVDYHQYNLTLSIFSKKKLIKMQTYNGTISIRRPFTLSYVMQLVADMNQTTLTYVMQLVADMDQTTLTYVMQ